MSSIGGELEMERSYANNSNDKRIAKNTLIMYGRMLLVTLITLFTVRIALKALGVEDYGIYNVVAGLVTFTSFIGASMQIATLRFYAFAIGEKSLSKQNAIFNLSFLIYLIIVVLVIVLAETVGLWFLKNEMIIPVNRFNAALWLFQFAIFSFVVSMLSIPFSSMIIAHEHMGVYAVISLIECVLKLSILFLIALFSYDKLFIYGLLMLVVTLIKEGIGIVYCRKKYEECFFQFTWDKELFKSIYSYSGWTLFGTLANVAYNQGNNILINVFFGPVANAARAIAFQVSNTMTMFSSNFFTVISPQIIKSYAEEDYSYMMRLFYLSSKFSYCLLLVIFLPLLLETQYILNLWLGNVSEYMLVFTRLTLIASFIMAMHSPITTVVQAIGAVKKYHVIVESVILLSLPLSYLCFKLGYSVESTFYISIVVFIIAHGLRTLVLKNVIRFSLKEYLKKFILPVSLITIIPSAITIYFYYLLPYGFIRFIIIIPVSMLLVSVCSFLFGFNRNEKQQIINMIKKRL
ncbi:MAG: oligosaccharide flippase family protein [Paludibacteraceae bacterium]|nr:oligosaccharide flippase family protein [Paludibacteraceae bacterium]